MEKSPKIFISYTHDSKDHIEKVLDISNKLRADGIDAILDQYEQSPPQGWPQWMDQNICNADFVLMVCTKNYYKRIMGEEEKGIGLGIKWEGKLIYQHIYNSDSQSNKFIPIILDESDVSHIPLPVQGHTHYKIDDQEQYEKLYWFLRGVNPTKKPEIGKLKPLPEKEKKSLFVGGFIDIDLWDKAKWSGTGVMLDRQLKEPPTLIFIFREAEFAKKIIENWKKRLGETDEFNELRISIIEGDIPGEEKGYTVHINSNVSNIVKRMESEGIEMPYNMFLMIGRIHRMNPHEDSKNLEYLKNFHKRFGSYFIKVGVLNQDGNIDVLDKLFLHKRDIEFRNVSDITSKDDMDSIVLPKYRNQKSD